MDQLISALLIVGVIAFITQTFIKLFSQDSSSVGTPIWRWKNILLIIAGVCLFVLLGLVNFSRFFQEQDDGSSIIAGITFLLVGVSIIWVSISELLRHNLNPIWVAYFQLGGGTLLIFWMGYDLLLYDSGNSQSLLKNLVLIVFGLFVAMTGIQGIKSQSSSN